MIPLEEAVAIGAIPSASWLFEKITRFAKSHGATDGTWGFSDARGSQLLGSALKNMVLSLLPKGIGEDVKRAFYFAVKDIRK